MSKIQVPCLLIEVFLCFDSGALCAAPIPRVSREGGGSQTRLQRGAPQLPRRRSSLEQLTFWNQWVSKMEKAERCIKTQNTLAGIYGASFRFWSERPESTQWLLA